MTKVMINPQKSKAVTEDDVMFFDVNPVAEGDAVYVKPTPCSRWLKISLSEFIQWLCDIGRVDHCDPDADYVSVYGCGNTYAKLWQDIASTREADKLVFDFLNLKNNQA